MAREQIWNLPNALTMLRMAVVPLMLLLPFMMSKTGSAVLAWLYIVAAVTDIIDGWLARRGQQVTDLGKLLDPLADPGRFELFARHRDELRDYLLRRLAGLREARARGSEQGQATERVLLAQLDQLERARRAEQSALAGLEPERASSEELLEVFHELADGATRPSLFALTLAARSWVKIHEPQLLERRREAVHAQARRRVEEYERANGTVRNGESEELAARVASGE